MEPIVCVRGLGKTHPGGVEALREINLDIGIGEIFALLGPNGAGKTTLIGTICGLHTIQKGSVTVSGYDVVRHFRTTRTLIGLVPQELMLDNAVSVWTAVSYTRGLYGLPPDPAHIEHVLRLVRLWDKRTAAVSALSGGMKRRVLIAKALSHNPRILFLDEPTAGVDIQLRREMWNLLQELRSVGVTIVLTTHYLEEAEMLSDRIGVINKGQMVLVEPTGDMLRRLGASKISVKLAQPLVSGLAFFAGQPLAVSNNRQELMITLPTQQAPAAAASLLKQLFAAGVDVASIDVSDSSLEDIITGLLEAEG
jgi:ABC-2 type transport system ATP-binding protein